MYIDQEGALYEIRLFAVLPNYPGPLSIMYSRQARDTAAGSRRKRCRHFGGCSSFEVRTARLEMELLFVCCAEEVILSVRLAEILENWMCEKLFLLVTM